jgi:hypothetical protein
VSIRRRVEFLEELVPHEASRIRAEGARRMHAIADLLKEADRPDAAAEVRARAARVRELLEIAEQWRERAEREPWKGAP